MLDGVKGAGQMEVSEGERESVAREMEKRIRGYASDESGVRPGVDVWFYSVDDDARGAKEKANGEFVRYHAGKGMKKGQRLVYVDGGFDLFSSGHIEFLRSVDRLEKEKATKDGWYAPEQKKKRKKKRIDEYGEDFERAYVVAGVHDDEVINRHKGVNYPIMNVYERGLCVLQCRVGFPIIASFGVFYQLTKTNSTFTPSFSALPSRPLPPSYNLLLTISLHIHHRKHQMSYTTARPLSCRSTTTPTKTLDT